MKRNKVLWLKYRAKSVYRKLYSKVAKHKIVTYKYAGKNVLPESDANTYLYNEILKNTNGLMVSRYGCNELAATIDYLRNNGQCIKNSIQSQMVSCAGFFPNDNQALLRFAEIMLESSREIDVLGIMFSPMEDYMINAHANQATLIRRRSLEPWKNEPKDGEKPWTYALKGKRVLVIHPFDLSIKKQYQRRTELFENPDILPEFELITFRAVQTIAGQKDERFHDWFEALEYMYDEAMKTDFDVALLGCGAYGLPLAAKLKKSGKIAIHIGGALQLLFGIKGKRWNTDPIVSKLYNEAWTSPMPSETPKANQVVENGCYW